MAPSEPQRAELAGVVLRDRATVHQYLCFVGAVDDSNGIWDTNEENYLNFNADGGPPIPLAD
jgi:hypothetical protein